VTATAAPTGGSAKYTASLFSHHHPVVSRTGSWHTVFPRSKRASQAGHSYLPCSVAPSRESASMPAKPALTRVANPGATPRGASETTSPAISVAPATPPSVPSAVIPPEVPRVTRRQDVTRRGGRGEKAPISVAQVSAAAAATAPAAADHDPSSAAIAATPPFASTCLALRSGARRSASCVRRLPESKKAASTASPGQPNPHATPNPTPQAATSPPGVSHLTRRTARSGCGASTREGRPGPGSGPAGTAETAYRNRTLRHRGDIRRGAAGSRSRARA